LPTGSTEERFIGRCDCGSLVVGAAPRWIDAQAQPELLTQLLAGTFAVASCPKCGAEVGCDLAVAVVHDPLEVTALVLPAGRRTGILQELTAYLARLAERLPSPGDPLPGHLLAPVVVVGPVGLQRLLDTRTAALQREQLAAQLQEERRLLEEERAQLATREAELTQQAAALTQRAAQLDALVRQVEARTAEQDQQQQALAAQQAATAQTAQELGHRRQQDEERVADLEQQSARLAARLAGLAAEERKLEAGRLALATGTAAAGAREGKLDEQEALLRTLEQELTEREQRLAQAEEELRRSRDELQRSREALQRTEAELQSSAAELRSSWSDLRRAEEQQRAHLLRSAAGTEGPAPALDIELMPGLPFDGPAPVPSPATLPRLAKASRVATAPLAGGLLQAAGLDGLAAGLPERVSEQTALSPIDLVHLEEVPGDRTPTPEASLPVRGAATAAERGRSPLPTTTGGAASTERGPGEEQFLDDEGWTKELDRAWDMEMPVAQRAVTIPRIAAEPAAPPTPDRAVPPVAAAPPAPGGGAPPVPSTPAPVSSASPSPPAAAASPTASQELRKPATDRETTRRVRFAELAGTPARDDEGDLRARNQRSLPVGPFERWEAPLFGEDDRQVILREGEVYLCCRCPGELLGRLLEQPLDLIVQLHRLPAGAVVLLTLLAKKGEAEAALPGLPGWCIDHRSREGQDALAALSFSFRPSVVLFDGEGAPRRQLRFERPLEANVSEVLFRANRWDADVQVDPPAARRSLAAPDHDLLGRKQHPFHQEAFSRIESPGQARFALGVLGYWLEPENRDYLTLIKGFPLEELASITRRILRGAIEFGIALPEPLVKEAVSFGLARDPLDLLGRTLASFAEVCLHIKPYDLDDFGEWDNWELLLSRADELGIDVDPEIIRLAESSMQRVQLLAQAMSDRRGDVISSAVDPREAAGLADEPTVVTRLDSVVTPTPGPPPPGPPPLPPPAPSPLPRAASAPAAAAVEPPPDAAALVPLLADDALAEDATAALVLLGRPAAEELWKQLRAVEAEAPVRPRLLTAFGRLGPPALALLAEELRKRRRPEELIDRCLLSVAQTLGAEGLEAEKRQGRKLKDVVKRAQDLLARQPVASPAAGSSRSKGPAGRAATPTPPRPHPPGKVSGDLEALLGEELRARTTPLTSASDSGEIPIEDADILEDAEAKGR
jgi:hypothetical protein